MLELRTRLMLQQNSCLGIGKSIVVVVVGVVVVVVLVCLTQFIFNFLSDGIFGISKNSCRILLANVFTFPTGTGKEIPAGKVGRMS